MTSLSSLLSTIERTKNSEAVNFMEKPLFTFDPLRKMNKDVPAIKKATKIEVVDVSGIPTVYTRDQLSEDAKRNE